MPATGPQPAAPSYRGIFTIAVGAKAAVELPPSVLAVSVHTSGWPASAFVTRYVRARPTFLGRRPPLALPPTAAPEGAAAASV